MIQMQTSLEVADNSGARRVEMIMPIGGSTGKIAALGDRIKVTVKEASPDGTIKKGTVHGTVVQNPYQYGYKSIEVLNGILRGNASAIPTSKFIDIPARQIRKNNVDEFWADLKAKVGGGK